MATPTQIIFRPISAIYSYEKNARTHSGGQVAEIAASIREYGWTNPILIDEQGEIIAGHGRLAAAELLELNEVPVMILSALSDEQKRAYRLADNKIPLNAGWDIDLLKLEICDLLDSNFDMSLTGFTQVEIDELMVEVGSVEREFFAFMGDEKTRGFRHGGRGGSPWYRHGDAINDSATLSDAEMRTLISARCIKNFSRCNIDDVERACNELFGSSGYQLDITAPCVWTITIFSIELFILFAAQSLDVLPRASGIRYEFIEG